MSLLIRYRLDFQVLRRTVLPSGLGLQWMDLVDNNNQGQVRCHCAHAGEYIELHYG